MTALILIYDLIARLQYLSLHYGVNSVLPPELLFDEFLLSGAFTFHLIIDDIVWLYLLFGIKLICYLSLLIGYKTTLSTFLSWLLLLSLHNANPLILNSGDAYLRLLLFWAIFLPWGTWYSLDVLKNDDAKSKQYFSIATIAFTLQICFMYLFTGLLKNSSEWLTDGTALQYALSLKQLSKPFGAWLLQYPEFLNLLTYGTVVLEIMAPVLILFPKWNSKTKAIAILMYISFHLAIFTTMMVGLFSFICIVALFAIIPHQVAEYVYSRWSPPAEYSIESAFTLHPITHSFKNYFLSVTLCIVFVWNLSTITKVKFIPELIEYPVHFLRLDQRWAMFAPKVTKDDGWFTFEAVHQDNRIDLFQKDNQIIQDSPENWLFMYRNYARWRKFFSNLRSKENAQLYESTSRSLIFHYINKKDTLNAIEIYYFIDWSNLGYNNIVEGGMVFEFIPFEQAELSREY